MFYYKMYSLFNNYYLESGEINLNLQTLLVSLDEDDSRKTIENIQLQMLSLLVSTQILKIGTLNNLILYSYRRYRSS